MEQKKLYSVLLIDDDEPTTFMYKMVLEESGWISNIQIAQGGGEALNLLAKGVENILEQRTDYPDIVFLDINMPKMDGWEFLQGLKELGEKKKKRPVVVMLSTSLNPDDEMRAAQIQEISAYRHKPLTVAMIREIVAKYLPWSNSG